ncbi:VanW family protein [Spongisporangium articulatum]|uniref:VanW family protein n=1 Tax=Spongisporangium articulatum TaxID=3362603 RepID=A0ABW8AQ89_9ACTN
MPSVSVPRRVWLIAGAVAGTAVVAYGAAALAVAGKVPKGTTVAGLDVGGLSRAQAQTKLAAAHRELRGTLPVKVGESAESLDLARSGLGLDAEATTGQFSGFSLNPARVVTHVTGGRAHEALPRAPFAALDTALRPLAADVLEPATEAGVAFKAGKAKLVEGAPGLRLAPDATSVLRSSWLGPAHPVTLPTAPLAPKITRETAEQALETVAEKAVSGPLTLAVGSHETVLAPAAFTKALSMTPDAQGDLQLAVDGEVLRDAILKQDPEIGTAPKDATFKLQGGRPVVVPGVNGVTIDPKSLSASVVPALTGPERKASVETAVEEPELSTAEARKLGVKERISTFSTILTADSKRTENLRIAARTVNGTVVLPGETFSLNGVLGKRTPEKGYNEAPAILGGRLIKDYGGGVSQMATTIFNNVFFSGLQDVYHKPHSFYISRYPEGREATVNYPTVDMKWRNDSKYAVLIQANVTDTVNVSFWSTKVWKVTATKGDRTNQRAPKTIYDDKDGCVAQAANPGFDVTVTRTMRRVSNPGDVRKQTWKTTYIAEDKVVCGPQP